MRERRQAKSQAQVQNRTISMPSTTASLVCLFVGFVLGALIKTGLLGFLNPLAILVEPLGIAWSRALQMVVFPLAVASLLGAVVVSGSRTLGRLVMASFVLFLVLLIFGAFFSVATTKPLLPLIPVTSNSTPPDLESSAETTPVAASNRSLRDWLTNLIPANVLKAAAEGNLAQVLVFAMLFALAVSRLPDGPRARLGDLITSLQEAVLLMVQWILRVTPFAVFLLALSFSRARGLEGGRLLGSYVLLISALLLATTLLLYPIAVFLGRVKLGVFSRALLAGQMVAVSTRSSLASVPALLQSARSMLPLPRQTMAFSIPFAAAVFKMNRTVSGMVKFLFLAHLYGIDPGTGQIATFVFLNLMLSIGSPGLPGGPGAFRLVPAYAAAGIPVEGIVLIEAVDVIPDIFKTLLNTTGYMTVSVLLCRLVPSSPEQQPAPLVSVPAGE